MLCLGVDWVFTLELGWALASSAACVVVGPGAIPFCVCDSEFYRHSLLLFLRKSLGPGILLWIFVDLDPQVHIRRVKLTQMLFIFEWVSTKPWTSILLVSLMSFVTGPAFWVLSPVREWLPPPPAPQQLWE